MHLVSTVVQQKVALTQNDDKRYILPNQIDTLPWGHKNVPPDKDLIHSARLANNQRVLVPQTNTLENHKRHVNEVIESVIKQRRTSVIEYT